MSAPRIEHGTWRLQVGIPIPINQYLTRIVIIDLKALKLASLEYQQGARQWHHHPQQHGAD